MIRALLLIALLLPSAFALPYPATRKDDSVVDKYHGTEVKDPYRWLEDDNAAETKAWVTAQNAVTEKYLAGIPQRDEIRDRLKKLWNYERFGLPRGGRRPVVFREEFRPAGAGVLYVTDSPRRRTARSAGSQHAVEGWHGVPVGLPTERGRQAAGLRDLSAAEAIGWKSGARCRQRARICPITCNG